MGQWANLGPLGLNLTITFQDLMGWLQDPEFPTLTADGALTVGGVPVPMIRQGSAVVTTSSTGHATVAYTPFPTALDNILLFMATCPTGHFWIAGANGNGTNGSITFVVSDESATPIVSTPARVNYVAFGH